MTYIDGLKGWCAISICVLHIIMMFKIDGYVGWGATEEAILNPWKHYFDHFPYSILVNNTFPLYIFFLLFLLLFVISFLK